MAAGVRMSRRRRVALGVAAPLALAAVLAQALLPSIAADRARARVARYGTVRSVSVSAWPAIELLWGSGGSVRVSAGALTMTPSQMASLLWEARGVSEMAVSAEAVTLRVAELPHGLTVSEVRMERRGGSLRASALLTQAGLDAALPSGFQVEPIASGGGEARARASGALFGVRASIEALVRPLEGRLVAEPQGLPFAGLATITLFSDPHLRVEGVGVAVERERPLTYRLSLRASLR